MENLKHTKGEWEVSSNYNQGIRILINQHDARITTNVCSVSGSPDLEETKSNAKLIAEAGTVANETGKTPRRLADENKELLEALIQIREWYEKNWSEYIKDMEHKPTPIVFSNALDVINKATK